MEFAYWFWSVNVVLQCYTVPPTVLWLCGASVVQCEVQLYGYYILPLSLVISREICSLKGVMYQLMSYSIFQYLITAPCLIMSQLWAPSVNICRILKGYSSSRDPVSLDISWDVVPAVKKWRVGDKSIFSQLAQNRGWISSDSGSWQDE